MRPQKRAVARIAAVCAAAALAVGCNSILGVVDFSRAGEDSGPGEDSGLGGSHTPDGGADATVSSSDDAGNVEAGNVEDGSSGVVDAGAEAACATCNTPPTCDGGPGACVVFTPSGGVEKADLDGTGLSPVLLPVAMSDASDDAGLSGVTVLDVDNGMMTSDGVVIRPASTGDPSMRDVQNGIAYRQTTGSLAVVTFGSLTIPQGATLRFVGLHAVAIASASTIRIDGLVDARASSADGTVVCAPVTFGTPPNAPGAGVGGAPGGYNASHGGSSTPSGSGTGMGAGVGGSNVGTGGGHAGSGGAACAPGNGTCFAGGPTYDTAALDETHFHGGSGGGGGGVNAPICGPGGGGSGGGAIRIVAASFIEIGGGTQVGGVNASGCGGGKSPMNIGDGGSGSSSCGGGGGGSGGAIVVEAPRVQIDTLGALNASGGGGGSVDRNGDTAGLVGGAEGCFVPIGRAQSDLSGNGGSGASTSGVPGEIAISCAGGGAAGWIRINATNASPVLGVGAAFSPTQTSGAMVVGATAAP